MIRLLSDFKINKFFINIRIICDYFFIKKINKVFVVDKIDEWEFFVD